MIFFYCEVGLVDTTFWFREISNWVIYFSAKKMSSTFWLSFGGVNFDHCLISFDNLISVKTFLEESSKNDFFLSPILFLFLILWIFVLRFKRSALFRVASQTERRWKKNERRNTTKLEADILSLTNTTQSERLLQQHLSSVFRHFTSYKAM